MKIFLGSLVIFFGTLLAAGLVALGQPGEMGLALFGLSPEGGAEGVSPLRSGWDGLIALFGLR